MLLGEYIPSKKTFPELQTVLKQFQTQKFKKLFGQERREEVNRALLELIQKEPEPCFLLAAVLDFVERIDRGGILSHYTFNGFELWLNHQANLTAEENYRIRAKIAGKFVDRSDYQVLFPIGMGRVYEGTHFVTAHKSPDLDTTVASFWGWLDAFAARVGDSLHVWNLPGGPPSSQIEIDFLFRSPFGTAVFTHLSRDRTALNLTGSDLMTQKGMIRKTLSETIASAEHEREHQAVVIVDDHGFYLGDWRSFDVEDIRQVILLFSACLRWFENYLHVQLISLLAKEDLHLEEVRPWLTRLFAMPIRDCEPATDFDVRQRRDVALFMTKVLGFAKGLDATFEEIGLAFAAQGLFRFQGATMLIQALQGLFDEKGNLHEDRPRIFGFLEIAVRKLHEAILAIRRRLERFDVALKTKVEVFGHHPTLVTVRSDVGEIEQTIGSYPTLTVAYPDRDRMFPVGIIQAPTLRKKILGTVSLRDFCNREEMTIPPYLDVISVIDHHKSELKTISPPFAIIADAQSSNTLVALQAFQINDLYSLGTQSPAGVQKQWEKGANFPGLAERLLKKRRAVEKKGHFYIHPDREFLEYLHFLYAILDDTDLLSKVSRFDVECVASLLNRLKSLVSKEEVEVLSLDDIPRDEKFPKAAAQRLLRHEEMYSLYRRVYDFREKEVEKNIHLAVKGESESNLFADTKEQNGCCRVGQTKLFATNIPLFSQHADAIRKIWLKMALAVHHEKREIDLHLHMISTIVSAEEVYRGGESRYVHKDELWIWIPEQDGPAVEHLKRFLSAFQSSPGLKAKELLELEFAGDHPEELKMIFKESFWEVPASVKPRGLSMAILRFKAGALNSRKALVTPFLPDLGVVQ